MSSLAHFQDREDAIAAFDRLWERERPWVLAFTGFSGYGKSTLLDWLAAKRCEPQTMPYGLIGVGEYAGGIRNAFHALFQSAHLRRYLDRDEYRRYQQERKEALAERNRREVALSQSQVMVGSAEGEQQMSANLAEAYRAMEAQADELIFEAWLDCFETLAERERVVLLLDNYDSFQDRAAVAELKRFWQVLEQAQGRVPGLRVVAVSREPIRHRYELRALERGLAVDDLQPLAAADSEALLLSLGVTDAAYRQAVFRDLAQGHPLLTQMAAEVWQEAAGAITAAAVPQQISRDGAVEWVQGRILERLQGTLQEAVRWAALLRSFDAESLGRMLGETVKPAAFRKLTQRASIIRPRLAPDAWACHDLVRRVQSSYLQRERPQQFQDFHQQAQTYYLEQENGLEALYHHFFLEPSDAFAAWREMESEAAFHFDHAAWSTLIEIGLAPELRLSAADLATVLYRAGRRHYYRAEWDEATLHFDRALQRFNDIGDRLGQANVQQSLGKLYLGQDETERGLETLRQALALHQSIGDRVGQTNIHAFLARWRAERDEFAEALVAANDALTLALSFIPNHPFTQWLADFREQLAAQVENGAGST